MIFCSNWPNLVLVVIIYYHLSLLYSPLSPFPAFGYYLPTWKFHNYLEKICNFHHRRNTDLTLWLETYKNPSYIRILSKVIGNGGFLFLGLQLSPGAGCTIHIEQLCVGTFEVLPCRFVGIHDTFQVSLHRLSFVCKQGSRWTEVQICKGASDFSL